MKSSSKEKYPKNALLGGTKGNFPQPGCDIPSLVTYQEMGMGLCSINTTNSWENQFHGVLGCWKIFSGCSWGILDSLPWEGDVTLGTSVHAGKAMTSQSQTKKSDL